MSLFQNPYHSDYTGEEFDEAVVQSKKISEISRDISDLKESVSPTLIDTLGLEPSDVVKCDAARRMIRAIYIADSVPTGHKVVLSSIFKLNGRDYFVSLTDYSNGTEIPIITRYRVDADKLCELWDADYFVGYIYIDSSNYSEIENQGEGLNRMPFLSSACFDKSRQPIISTFSTEMRLEKLEASASKRICIWGDSITWGAGASDNNKPFANLLQTLVRSFVSHDGDLKMTSHEVWNCGVGGDNMVSILARCGGSALYLTQDVTLPASGSDIAIDRYENYQWQNGRVKVAANPTDTVNLMVQGEYGRGDWGTGEWGDARRTVNPVVVNGRNCIWTWTQIGDSLANGMYSLRLANPSNKALKICAGTPIYPQGSRIKADVMIFCGGTNGGFGGDPDTYVKMVEAAIEASGAKEYIVCSPYGGTCWTEMGGIAGMVRLETACQKRFGAHYFNWRTFMLNEAFDVAGIAKSTADTSAINKGKCPPSFLDDEVHPNDAGHRAIATKLLYMLDALGYI